MAAEIQYYVGFGSGDAVKLGGKTGGLSAEFGTDNNVAFNVVFYVNPSVHTRQHNVRIFVRRLRRQYQDQATCGTTRHSMSFFQKMSSCHHSKSKYSLVYVNS